MDLKVNRINKVVGIIKVPGDKSISHRAIMLGGIAEGETHIHNLLLSDDIISTSACLGHLGVDVYEKDGITIVKGMNPKLYKPYKSELYAGNSGTTVRLLLGLISGSSNTYTFTGDPSLSKRPMNRITDPLEKMGASICYNNNDTLLPVTMKGGNLKSIQYKLPVASAQVKSSIILASLHVDGTSVIEEPIQTRDHTEIMINDFGGNIKKEKNYIKVTGGQKLVGKEIVVPGDISSAAFLIVLALVSPSAQLVIKDVGLNPTRTGIIDVLKEMGAKIEILSQKNIGGEVIGDILVKDSSLTGTTIEGNIIPRLIDEIPILAVAALFAEGETIIRNAEELKIKESNRIFMIVNELKKMGANIEETSDGMIIKGQNKLHGTLVNSGADHRIAMALTIAGMNADGDTRVSGAECIRISYPNFIKTLKEISK